jgi:hypothetical protein
MAVLNRIDYFNQAFFDSFHQDIQQTRRHLFYKSHTDEGTIHNICANNQTC